MARPNVTSERFEVGAGCSTWYVILCYTDTVKTYVHARLSPADRAALEELKAATGKSESDLIRLGVRLATEALVPPRSANDLAGESVGRFSGGPNDLSRNRAHLDGFGE